MNYKWNIRCLLQAAMFLALAYLLPFFTGQLQQMGNMLCPMHIPVLLCGFICGGSWGMLVGGIAPILRSLTLGMPVLFPTSFCMALELAAYGAVAGILYRRLPKKKLYIYAALFMAMLIGRLVWGAAMFVCMGLDPQRFGISSFLTGAIIHSVPGMIIQVILIPVLVMVLNKVERF